MAKFSQVNIDSGADGAATVMLAFKAALKAAGWTVPQSSDGLTLFANDGITTPGVGATGMDNTNAWFRIQDPAGLREFCFQRSAQAATQGYQWRVKYSASAKFVSAPTGGGATAATRTPSATDEQIVLGSGTDNAPGFASLCHSGAAGTWYGHTVAQSTPEAGVYGWWFFCTTKATGAVDGAAFCEPLLVGTYPVADVEPLMLGFGTTCLSVNNGQCASWYKKGLGGETWKPATDGYRLCTIGDGGAYKFGSDYVGANPYSGEDDGIPTSFARSAAVAQAGWRGFSKYIRIRGVNRGYPDTANLASADAYVYTVQVLFPWPTGVVPLL